MPLLGFPAPEKESTNSAACVLPGENLQIILNFFDALPCYGLLFDRDYTIKTANRKFLDTIGLHSKELIGMPLEALETYLPGVKEQFTELREYGSRTFHTRLTDKNGTAFFVEHTLIHVEDQGREIIACIGHDLHKLTSGQETVLRKTELQLIAAKRLKRKFIANINHAIRTPMNAIIGYAEILAESGLSEQQQHFVNIIRKNGTALISIINDVMELSKLETGNVKVLKSAANLEAVVEQATDLFAEQIQAKKLNFDCVLQPDLPEMYIMDADHCRQVLINLISNGVKFTDRGTISLEVTGTETSPDLYDLLFRVSDTGIGMSTEEQQAVLDVLKQQEEKVSLHDGTRLGLTLCAHLARMMGGEIRMESIRGQGSSFFFKMPAKIAGKNGIRQEYATARQAIERRKKKKRKEPVILVVDDMPEMSHLVKIYFTNSPIKVLEAACREDCLRLALSEQPDLILMDLDLAGVDGRDVTSQLKEDVRTTDIPVVVMTGLMLEKESLKPLFDDFLAKPFHLQELQRLVDKYIQVQKNSLVDAPQAWGVTFGSDLEQIQAVWNKELDSVYSQAQMSGNLDDALDLGRKMEIYGRQMKAVELTAMGIEMKKFALDFDIRGVEQMLTALRKITEEKR